MKKILFLLVFIYSFSNALTITEIAGEQYSINFSSETGITWNTTTPTPPHCGGWANVGYLIYQRSCYSGGQTKAYWDGAGRYGYKGSQITTTATLKLKISPNEPNTCSQSTILTDEELFQCNPLTGDLDFLPNPDPLGGAQCRDLFQKDGVAYSCNPNNNQATRIPYSNGVTTDPETGDDVPNCNEGYSYTNSPNMSVGGTGTSYYSHTCTKNLTNPDGSITGDNGVTVYPDGSVETPNPDGSKTRVFTDGSTTTTYPDGSTTSTPAPTPPTDSGTGTSGGSTGGTGTDTGTGSTTGGDSGTGSTGGTTGTDTGTGSTGGTDSGTGTTGGTSGTGTDTGGSTGGTGTSGGGSTGGTDSGSTNGGTTGTDSGTGTNTGTTDPTTGADDCNDLNMTLTEKTLCKIKNVFTPTPNNTPNPLQNSGGLIDGFIGEYSTFKTNISNQGDTLKSLVYTSIDTVNQGFSFNISPNEVVSCPKDYTLDLSALNMSNMNVVLDICLQTSKLKPYFYPLFLIMFSVGTTLITFRMLGVLI